MITNNVTQLIGNTPLIKLKYPSEISGCEIYGKAEFMNPAGSVKDRTALGIIEDAEEKKLLEGALSNFDAIIVRSATKLNSEIISKSKGLKFIGRAGVGVDNIDLEAAGKSGIMVVNAPNASTQSVVELTIGHLLASLRHIPKSDRSLRSGKWEKSVKRKHETD